MGGGGRWTVLRVSRLSTPAASAAVGVAGRRPLLLPFFPGIFASECVEGELKVVDAEIG